MFDQLRYSSTPLKKKKKLPALNSLLIKRKILPPSGLPGRKQPMEHQQLQKPFIVALDQELQARCKSQLPSSSQRSETSENSGLDPGLTGRSLR